MVFAGRVTEVSIIVGTFVIMYEVVVYMIVVTLPENVLVSVMGQRLVIVE